MSPIIEAEYKNALRETMRQAVPIASKSYYGSLSDSKAYAHVYKDCEWVLDGVEVVEDGIN